MSTTTEAPSGHPERDETEAERSDRQLNELLQELRVTLPGVQVLFAFLLTVPFSARFESTTPFQRDVYFAALLGTALATALLMGPTALHRLQFSQGVKPDIVRVSHILTLAGIAILGLAITTVVLLVTDVIFSRTGAFVVGGATLAVFVGLWVVLPLTRRSQQ